jgi:hypothetical protein
VVYLLPVLENDAAPDGNEFAVRIVVWLPPRQSGLGLVRRIDLPEQ